MNSTSSPEHRTIVAVNAADARARLTKALDAKYIGEISGNMLRGVRVDDVIVFVFYNTVREGDLQHGIMPTAIHMNADILRELIGATVEYQQTDLFKTVK